MVQHFKVTYYNRTCYNCFMVVLFCGRCVLVHGIYVDDWNNISSLIEKVKNKQLGIFSIEQYLCLGKGNVDDDSAA